MIRDYICMYMVHVCFYVCCSDCVGICGKFVVYRPLLKIMGFEPWNVVCLCKVCDGYCVFCLYCEAWSCRY